MHVDKVQAWCRPPVSQQSGLNVFQLEGFLEEGIVEEIDLSDGQVIGCPPIGVYDFQLFGGKHVSHRILQWQRKQGAPRCSAIAAIPAFDPGELSR